MNGPFQTMKLTCVALMVLVANVFISVLYMVVYGHLIDPGHDSSYYQAHIQNAAPWCSIVAGIPLMFVAGRWVAGWKSSTSGNSSAFGVWLAYTLIDLVLLLAAGMTVHVFILFLISFSSKLAAALFGARKSSHFRK